MRFGRIGIYLLASAVVATQSVLWFGQNGVVDYVGLKQDLTASKERNTRLEKRNNKLLDDVVNLKSKTDAIEEIARAELGMIRRDEVFYQVIERP